MDDLGKICSFARGALCALLLSAFCHLASGAGYWVDSSKFCYANNFVAGLSGEFANVVTPKEDIRFLPRLNPIIDDEITCTYTASPPQGYMLTRTGPNWVVVNLDIYGRVESICIAYTNVGYSIEVKYSDLAATKRAKTHMAIATCFEWLKYDLHLDKNLPGNVGEDTSLAKSDVIYTNTVALAERPADWSDDRYTFKGLSLSSNETAASFQFGETVEFAGEKFEAKTNGVYWAKNGVVTLYGVWTPRYKVIFDGNGGKGPDNVDSIGPTNYDYGVTWQLPSNVFEKAGCEFVGWSTNRNASAEESVQEGTSVSNLTDVAGGEVTFYAIWRSVVHHAVTFSWQSDEGETNVVASVREGDCAEVPDDVDMDALTGRSFIGWNPPDPESTTVTSNTVFTAQYTNNVYEVAFDANGGERGVTNYLDYASDIVAPTVEREGWRFVAWEPTPDETVPASNVCYVAQWSQIISYNVKFAYYDGDTVATNEDSVVENECATIPAGFNPNAREGYSFVGWNPPDPESTKVTSNTVFTAQYTNNVYEVAFDVGYDGGARVVTNLEFGAAIPQPPVVSRDGFVFGGWVPEPAGTVPASNVCYVAQWTEEQITYGDLATAADANFELTRGMNGNDYASWSVVSNEYTKGESSIMATMPSADSSYAICITGVVHGVGTISFRVRAKSDSDSCIQFEASSGKQRGLRFGYGNDNVNLNWMAPEPFTTTNEWNEFSIELGEESVDTIVWWYVYQDVQSYTDEYGESIKEGLPEFRILIDEIKWTPAAGPTEDDRPEVSGFSATSDGGFRLSISNASSSFDYVVLTNATLRTDVTWGEMKRVSGDQAGVIELERPDGGSSLFYRVGVEAK